MTNKELYDSLGLSEKAKEAIDQAKEQKIDTLYTRIAGREYIYRPITRKEWRTLRERMAARTKEAEDNPEILALIKEEELESLVELARVYYENNDTMYAGVIDTLSDAILLSSGFGGVEFDPVRL